MWKKALFTLAIVITAPLALVNCTASGSGAVKTGDDTGSSSESSTSGSGSSSGTTTRPDRN